MAKKKKSEEVENLDAVVVEAADAVSAATAARDDAQRELDEVLAVHAALTAPVEPEVDPEVHVVLEGKGPVVHSAAGQREYRIQVDGKNYEHVGDLNGAWVYRRM